MYKSNFKPIFIGLISILFLLGVFATSTIALEGVAGEVIKTIEDLKSLEAKGLITKAQAISYGELIKDFGKSIPIVKTTDRRPEVGVSKSYLEVTLQNKGKAKIGAGDLLENYAGAGLPFPDLKPDDPQAGLKAACNYDFRNVGDDFVLYDWEYPLTDGKGNVKAVGGNSYNLNYNFRTEIAPKPALFPGQYAEIWFKNRIEFSKPFASKGLSQLVIKYVDPKRARDVWVFVPGLRRSVRAGSDNRCDCLGGFTFNMDDSNAWAGDTSVFNWKLIAVKDMLVNTLIDFEIQSTGKTYVKGAHHLMPTLERRKMWMIEQTAKDPGYCYSKRIFYLDPESWWFLWEEMYDRAGKLWKQLDQGYTYFPVPASLGGGNIINTASGDCTDFKIWEAGPYWIQKLPVNQNISSDLFTLDALRRSGR